jgi:hypothetical protein
MILTLQITGLDKFLQELENDGMIESGVSVEGEAAAYAEVWEWGNARQTKKGPRTVLGTNPRGERVWLSSQAPYGYIWTNEGKFWDSISQELKKVTFEGPNKRDVREELEKASVRIATEIAKTISESAPVDTGQLSESFRVVESGDPLLEESE